MHPILNSSIGLIWCCPPFEWIKANCDEVRRFNDDMVVAKGILRDVHGLRTRLSGGILHLLSPTLTLFKSPNICSSSR
ncbi:hypothetical protein V6N12_050793 [Hibiscus sabdariffa]|uniref:Uncharacterized protein n=1 Tax=Hibiscus sabdariffa TaxID=183260 RepID=A0ABR2GDL3_9ROSI